MPFSLLRQFFLRARASLNSAVDCEIPMLLKQGMGGGTLGHLSAPVFSLGQGSVTVDQKGMYSKVNSPAPRFDVNYKWNKFLDLTYLE